jgi:hypothetical protein
MQGEFCRRESEDQPVVAGIDERVLDHIPEERFRVRCVGQRRTGVGHRRAPSADLRCCARCVPGAAGYQPPAVLPPHLSRVYLVAGKQEPFFLDNANRWAAALCGSSGHSRAAPPTSQLSIARPSRNACNFPASLRNWRAASGFAEARESAAARRSCTSRLTMSISSSAASARRAASARPTPTAEDSMAPARCSSSNGTAAALSIADSAVRYSASAARSRWDIATASADRSAAVTEVGSVEATGSVKPTGEVATKLIFVQSTAQQPSASSAADGVWAVVRMPWRR